MEPQHLEEAQRMAKAITEALTGSGLWGVEFFISRENGVYFSELSPRPHDTGMVTLAGTQNFNEFELHCRAALGLPIPCIKTLRKGASAVILSTESSSNPPTYKGIELTCEEDADVRIFGKPTTRPNRRMGVVVVSGDFSEDLDAIRNKAKRLASYVEVLTPTHNYATRASTLCLQVPTLTHHKRQYLLFVVLFICNASLMNTSLLYANKIATMEKLLTYKNAMYILHFLFFYRLTSSA